MNRYPLWKYLLILFAVLLGLLYALPNLYGEYPAIQISPAGGAQVNAPVLARVKDALRQANIAYTSATLSTKSARIRFADTETQIRARDVAQQTLGDDYTVALNLQPGTPRWLAAIGGKPMFLGLDLRGGVYFLMQVDMRAVIRKTEEGYADDMRRILRKNTLRYTSVTRAHGGGIVVTLPDAQTRAQAQALLGKELNELAFTDAQRGADYLLIGRISDAALADKQRLAIEQNMTSLRNRVNELGVAEPVIQQQGADRIVVELPGVQDATKAKEILGRTATLEIMMVDEEHDLASAVAGQVPPGDKIYHMRDGRPILLKHRVIYSGHDIVDAAPGFDGQNGQPIVSITLDARGAAINERVTGANVGKRMAVVYLEIRSVPEIDASGKLVRDAHGHEVMVNHRVEQVITAPVIRSQLGARFQIEGIASVEEANDLALLLRAGALAAPVEIVEERTVGPSLGADNIRRGFHSTWIGFAAIAVFMIAYYAFFGVISVIALAVNVILLVALLSILQATLTLPGMAGIALTVGMAIDANVLINERIREELRNGNTPQASIYAGYDRAFGTILDSNVTALIAGLALFMFGSGPVRGFAVVMCLGILTSMFSAVMGSRGLVNLLYGGRRKLVRLPIGNTQWR